MAYQNSFERKSFVPFFPFCSISFHELMKQCVGCDFAEHAGLATVVNGSVQFFSGKNSCNPHVHEYPLPLYKCGVCNQGALNAVLVYMFLVAILSVLGNGWSLAVWLKQGTKRPQTIFKLSLALSDFVFGLFVLPSTIASIINTMYMPHKEYYDFSTFTDRNTSAGLYETNWEALFISSHTDFIGFIFYLTQGASLSSILLLTIDRHLAITRHIKYYQIATRSKSVVIVIVVWLLAACSGIIIYLTMSFFVVKPLTLFLAIIESDGDDSTTVLAYLIPLSVVFLSSCTVALMTSRKLRKLSHSSGNCGLSKLSCWFSGLKNQYSLRKEITTQNRKSKRLKLVRKSKPKLMVLTGVKKTIDRNATETQIADVLRHQKSNNRSQTSSDKLQAEERIEKQSPQRLIDSTQKALYIKQVETKSTARACGKIGTSSSIHTTMLPRDNEYIAANRTLVMILLSYAFCVLPLAAMQTVVIFFAINDNESENAFRKKIDIGCTIAVAIFILSSLRNCVIYGIRNHEYRTISRALWKSIKSRCSTIVQENYRFDLTSRMKTATKVASSNLSQTVVRKK